MADSLHPELLSALLDGQLSAEQKSTVEAHLQNHPQDAAVFDDLQRLSNQLRGLPTLSAPADFQRRMMRRIHDSKAIPAIVATSGTQRSASNTVWLLACAASLAVLILAGILYGLNQNNPRLIGNVVPAPSLPQQPPEGKADRGNALREIPAAPMGNDAAAKIENPTPLAADSQPQGLGKSIAQSEPAGQLAPPPPAAAMAKQTEDFNVPSLDEANLAEELGQQVDPTPSDKIQNRGAFGGGMGGGAKDAAEALAKDGVESKSELSDAPSGEIAEPIVPTDACVRLDQLIFVQVPANQPAEEWIASVFRQAKVQIDESEEPESFGDVLQQRDDRKLAPAESEESQALSQTEKQELEDGQAMAENSKPELSPAPEYLKHDPTTTAYWVDAEVRQIRTIMDRLDGAIVVGFPNPGKWGPHGEERAQQKSYSVNPAIARRLGQLDVPPRADDVASDDSSIRQRNDESLKTQQAMDALGLLYQPPTARYRILFVFHAAAPPKADVIEAKPAPVK